MIEISELTEADEETLSSVNHLLPQLSGSASLITLDRLQVLAASECTRLYLAKEGDHIHGMLSLVVFGIPTGTKAWVRASWSMTAPVAKVWARLSCVMPWSRRKSSEPRRSI